MEAKVCLITGVTDGIGKATAVSMLNNNIKVIGIAKDKQKAQKLQKDYPNLEIIIADLSSQKEITIAVAKFKNKYKSLDILVNNAGVISNTYKVTKDGYEYTFAVNHLAPFLLTNLLLPVLKKSKQARIINVSSILHRKGHSLLTNWQTKSNYNAGMAYSQSKLANILFTQTLAQLPDKFKITSVSYHPGLVVTNIGNKDKTLLRKFINVVKPVFALTAEEAAKDLAWLCLDNSVLKNNGSYYVRCNVTEPKLPKEHKKLATDLWDYSVKATKLSLSKHNV